MLCSVGLAELERASARRFNSLVAKSVNFSNFAVHFLILLLPFAFGVMALSIAPALRSWSIGEISPDPGGLPRTWLKSLIPLGFLLLGLQGVAEALRLRWRLMHPDECSSAPADADSDLDQQQTQGGRACD